MKNLTLCLLMHLFGKSTVLCKCPLNEQNAAPEPRPINLNVNYITQKGRANIAGNGTIEYQTNHAELDRLERLEAENRMLADMVQTLWNRRKN